MDEERRHVSLVGPAVLIILGVLFLLNNLGWTVIRVWDLVRLWPVLLIAGGLDLLIGRRSRWGSVVVLVAMLALVGGGLWLLSASMPAAAGEAEVLSEPLAGAEAAQVEVGIGVGVLRVSALPDSDNVLQGRVELHRGERLVRSARTEDGVRIVEVRSEGGWAGPIVGWEGEKVWDLQLNEDVPTDLRIDAGVGDVWADLRRLTLRQFYLEAGVGRVTVVLPERGELKATIDGGVGELIVQVPVGVAVRVTASAGLGDVSVPQGYTHQGEQYVSPGYSGAGNRVDLFAEAGIGRISVEEYRGE